MIYALAQVAGKQFLLKRSEWYDIDFIKEGNTGNILYLNKILLFKKEQKIQLGAPFLQKSKILTTIACAIKGKKIIVLKTKPKKKYTRKRGHRQLYTRIQII